MKTAGPAIACVLGALSLSSQLHAELQRDGSDVVLTDTPRCRFAWPNWRYVTNFTSPLLLTKNTLDRSMISIKRIPAGGTLPWGKTKIAARMNIQQITSLLCESLQARGQDMDTVTVDRTKIAGTEGVRLMYNQYGVPIKGGMEYGFIRQGYFFHLMFFAVEDSEYSIEEKDFEHVASTFRVLK